jgi:hypothetical protein
MQNKKITIIALSAALAVSLAAIGGAVYFKNYFPGSQEDQTTSKASEGGTQEEIKPNGIDIKFLEEVNNTDGTSEKTFTYSVSPEPTVQSLKYALTWEDETVKDDVADFIQVSINQDQGKITIKCLKPFGHVINLSLISSVESSKSALVTLNYVQKFIEFDCSDNDLMWREDKIDENSADLPFKEFEAALISPSTAAFLPVFDDVYTKPHPLGNVAAYELGYNSTDAYTGSSYKVSSSTMQAIRELIPVAEGHRDVKCSDYDQSAILEIIDDLYANISYQEKIEVNKSGRIGIRLIYDVTATFGEEICDYQVEWAIYRDPTTLSSYTKAVESVNVEVTNIDF